MISAEGAAVLESPEPDELVISQRIGFEDRFSLSDRIILRNVALAARLIRARQQGELDQGQINNNGGNSGN